MLKKLISTALFTIVASLPIPVFAYSVSVTSSKEAGVGDIFVVSVLASEKDNSINAIEGAIKITNADYVNVENVSTGGSIFDLWAEYPHFDEGQSAIVFAGGSTKPLKPDNSVLFKIAVQAKSEGIVTFAPTGMAFFLANGKGTKIPDVLSTPDNVRITAQSSVGIPDEWQKIVAADKEPPAPISVSLGRNPALFGGQYFISFFTTDSRSGVAKYQVKEGNGDWNAATSPYALNDQSLGETVYVKAIDYAGNERITQFTANAAARPSGTFTTWLILGVILVAVCLFFMIARRIKKSRRNIARPGGPSV